MNGKRLALVATALATLGAGPLAAQEYPEKTVTFVVPYPAGGTVDGIARAIAEELEARWDEAVVVENRPGAGNIVGSTAVAQADPDGHTLLLGTTSVSSNPALFESLPFDPVEDFEPVTYLAVSANVLLVSPELDIDTLDDFVAFARDEGEDLTYGSVGRGSGHHLCMEMFQDAADVTLTHIPYQGVAPAVAAYRAGEVPVYCSDISGALALIRDGVAIPLGVTGTQRISAVSDVPTMVEQGLEDMDTAGFIGVMTTGGTPDDIVTLLSEEIGAVVAQPDFMARFSALGYDMAPGTPEAFAEFIAENTVKYHEIVERAGIPKAQ